MATKKRFKEAEFVDQNETQAQAVPATDAEVAQAAPVDATATAAPADAAAPAEDEAVLPEGTDETTEDSGVHVNPETVSVEVQIPTSDLGAAVAQVTGDQEVANLSPDVEASQEAELVADDTAEGDDIPVEGAVDEGAEGTAEAPAAEPQLESKKSEGDKLTEDVFTSNSEVEGQDNYGKGDSSDEDYQAGKKTADWHEEPRMDMIDHAIKVEGEALHEAEEDVPAAPVKGDADELPPGMDGGIDDDLDPALLEDGDGDIPGLGDNDVAIDEDDPAVQDFLSKIDGYLADEEAQPAQVADALRASADFFDAIAPEVEENDEDLLEVEDDEDGEIPLDLDAIETGNAHGKTGDEVLDQFSDVPADEDYEESLVRVPCKFPKKRFGESKRDLPLVKEPKRVRESFEDDGYFDEDEDWDVSAKFDRIVEEWGAEKTLNALFDYGLTNCPDLINDFITEVENGDVSLLESKKSVGKKFKEDVDYSAVKFPAGSEDADDNLVEAYEKTQASRRKAIKNFRESIIKDNENKSLSSGNSRFAEALRSSVRTNSRPSSNGNPNSWANNRFTEKMEEREEFNFKQLISEGYWG